jgi:FKBP-type peptidyl-prolyl cis-trans isomerase FkpA
MKPTYSSVYLKIFHSIFLLIISINSNAQLQTLWRYPVPDSVKPIGFYTEVKLQKNSGAQKISLSTTNNSLNLNFVSNKIQVSFSYIGKEKAKIMAQGLGTLYKENSFQWEIQKIIGASYKLYIKTVIDSFSKITLHSGYIFLSNQKKWKLLGTFATDGLTTIPFAQIESDRGKHDFKEMNIAMLSINNNWKKLDSSITFQPPQLWIFADVDSIQQQKNEEKEIVKKYDLTDFSYKHGIFFKVTKDVTGERVKETDTIYFRVKCWRVSDEALVFYFTKTILHSQYVDFIEGFKIGLKECSVGSQITMLIPSGKAYGIKTNEARVPPNSSLLFEVEIVNIKNGKRKKYI